MTPQETLIYWIKERYQIYQFKGMCIPKPWSVDPVFQSTYFCNVHRENDKVTRWIRERYSGFVDHPLFEYNMVLCRFLNSPPTLSELGYLHEHDPEWLLAKLEQRAARGDKVWGNAYVITTHGMKMPKAQYLCHDVLGKVYERLERLRSASRQGGLRGAGPTCQGASTAFQSIDGIGSFLAGQIVADLKNTVGHPLFNADDKATFVEPGPGSIRGLGWFWRNDPKALSVGVFPAYFQGVREYVDEHWPEGVPIVDNQDLQNCLCEFDKYMRVKTGSGRSKRGYNGSSDNSN